MLLLLVLISLFSFSSVYCEICNSFSFNQNVYKDVTCNATSNNCNYHSYNSIPLVDPVFTTSIKDIKKGEVSVTFQNILNSCSYNSYKVELFTTSQNISLEEKCLTQYSFPLLHSTRYVNFLSKSYSKNCGENTTVVFDNIFTGCYIVKLSSYSYKILHRHRRNSNNLFFQTNYVKKSLTETIPHINLIPSESNLDIEIIFQEPNIKGASIGLLYNANSSYINKTIINMWKIAINDYSKFICKTVTYGNYSATYSNVNNIHKFSISNPKSGFYSIMLGIADDRCKRGFWNKNLVNCFYKTIEVEKLPSLSEILE